MISRKGNSKEDESRTRGMTHRRPEVAMSQIPGRHLCQAEKVQLTTIINDVKTLYKENIFGEINSFERTPDCVFSVL